MGLLPNTWRQVLCLCLPGAPHSHRPPRARQSRGRRPMPARGAPTFKTPVANEAQLETRLYSEYHLHLDALTSVAGPDFRFTNQVGLRYGRRLNAIATADLGVTIATADGGRGQLVERIMGLVVELRKVWRLSNSQNNSRQRRPRCLRKPSRASQTLRDGLGDRLGERRRRHSSPPNNLDRPIWGSFLLLTFHSAQSSPFCRRGRGRSIPGCMV